MRYDPARLASGARRRIRRAFHRLGIEILPYRDSMRDQMRFVGSNHPVILDLGAHRGQSAKRYCRAFPKAHIYSFEPFPSSFARLQKVAEHHQAVHPFNLAVSENAGTVVLNTTARSQSNSLLPRPPAGLKYLDPSMLDVTSVEVQSTTLDEFAQQERITHIDILKMDIQGAEIRALRGARTLLQQQHIGLIFSEVAFLHRYENEPLFCEINSLLEGHGFSLYALYSPRHGDDGQLLFCDALFLHDSVRKSILEGASG